MLSLHWPVLEIVIFIHFHEVTLIMHNSASLVLSKQTFNTQSLAIHLNKWVEQRNMNLIRGSTELERPLPDVWSKCKISHELSKPLLCNSPSPKTIIFLHNKTSLNIICSTTAGHHHYDHAHLKTWTTIVCTEFTISILMYCQSYVLQHTGCHQC